MGSRETSDHQERKGRTGDMKRINVTVLEEYRGHIDPDRKYHLADIETGRELIGNLRKGDIENYVKSFHLTLVENPIFPMQPL
ncbi:MAG: hypothetical protein K1W23_15655 [Lachnospiraceae bacterium]